MLRKLASSVRQQYIGLFALFVALGGSAYAAATINSVNSQSVVDNSLTGADIRGQAASRGKPFTEGTLTGQDVKGSPAAPGRPAVNGSLTGADIADQSVKGADVAPKTLNGSHIADKSLTGGQIASNSLTGANVFDGSLTGADIFGKSLTAANVADNTLTGSQIADNSIGGGKISDKSIGGGKIADNSLTGSQIDESTLDTVPRATDSSTLGGYTPNSLGTFVGSASTNSSQCVALNTTKECAAMFVHVPTGRTYQAIIWSSISAYSTDAGTKAIDYCPGFRPVSGAFTCATDNQNFQDGINLQPNYSESGAAFGTTGPLTSGDWIFSTLVDMTFGTGTVADSNVQKVHTTVLLLDWDGPQLSQTDPSTTSGASGSSSGASGSSSGASGSSSGGSSSGSSGTSGCISSGSSSGASGSSSGASGSSTGGTSGGC